MKKYFLLALIFLLSSSCSYFSKKFETMAESKLQPTQINAKNNYCPAAPLASKLQYIVEDEQSLKFYRNLHGAIFENKSLSFLQKSVMLSLLEMSRRPDESSPYSRLQVYFKVNGQSYYYDFRPKNLEDDTKMPFLKGLDYLTQKFLPQQSLRNIASNLDTIIPTGMGVSSEFEAFLKESQEDIKRNEDLTSRFFKGDEILTKYETFTRPSYRSIVDQYMLPQFRKDSDYEFDKNKLEKSKSQQLNFESNCNYDLTAEPSIKDEILGNDTKKSHYFGLKEGNNFFLAVSSSILFKPFKSINKMSYFIKARPAPLPLPICEFIGKNQEIVLFSSNGRNPVQHLQHMVAYEIDQIDSSFTLNELLNFSRHLFLSNPDRILYESKRGRKAQLDFFLAMNFPIYHVENIGNVFGYAAFKNEKAQNSSLHIDERSNARLWCGQ